MKKTIKPFSARAAMMLLATLLLTLNAQTAWAQDDDPFQTYSGDGDLTITTPGEYTASGTINGDLIIQADVTLNVGNLTVTGDIYTNNISDNLTLNVGEGSHLNARGFSANTLSMTGGSISADDIVSVNAINMSDGEIRARDFEAGGEISGGTITVQNDFTAGIIFFDLLPLTISGGTIDIKGTLFSWDLELDATNSGLSLKINTFFNDDRVHLSITNGYVTDGTNIYGSEDTESLKNYLHDHGGTTLTKAVVYTVTFDMCDGGGGDDNAVVMYGHDMPTINLPTRDGYAFGGYFTARNGEGDQYYNADGTSTRTWNIANNATLYAKWTVIPHIVTSEMSGEWASGTYNVTSNVTIDGTVTITGDVILNINSGCTLNIANGHIDAYSNQSSLTFNGPGTLSVAEEINANTFNMTDGILSVATNLDANTFNMTGGTINAAMSIGVGGTISGGTIETGSLYIASLVIDATNSHSISIKADNYYWAYGGGCSLTINGTLYYAGNTELTGTFNNSNDLSAYNGNYLRTESYSNTYTVTFNANGGSGTMSPQTFTVGVAQNLSACTFSREGYTFDGWATTQGGDVAYTDGQSVTNLTTTAGGSVTLYAHWTENAAPVTTYTVTFDKNGGSGTMAAQTFTAGVAQNLSTCNFTREGYTFDGWATAANGAKVYDNGASVTDLASAGETTTLYAHWTPNTYTVIFDKNGGSGNQMDNQAFTYDVAQNLRECTYTKDGYTFDGWATADNGNVVYTDKQSVSNLTAVAGGTVTLYAHWAQDRIYTEGIYSLHDTNISGDIICKGNVTLIVDGELTVSGIRKEGEGSLTINVQDHSSITAGSIDANNLHMNGGSITAGSINVDNFNMTGGTVSVGSLTASGGDISDGTLSITGDFHTYYNTISGGNITVGGELQINGNLQYKANQATMSIYAKTYDLNAGSLTITSERGFSDGTTAYNGNNTIANPAALNGKTLKPAYKVTIEENGGSEVEDQFVAYGSTATEPNSTKTGYTATWYKGEDVYNFSSPVTEDFTLRAEWTANTYSVHFYGNGGDGSMDYQSFTYDEAAKALTANTFTREGYVFAGWATTVDGAVAYTDGAEVQNLTAEAHGIFELYAQWKKDIATCEVTMPDQALYDGVYTFAYIGYRFGDHPETVGEEVEDNGIKLTRGTDYSFGPVTFASDGASYTERTNSIGDVFNVVIIGEGDYAGTKTVSFTLVGPNGTWDNLKWSLANDGTLSITGTGTMINAETYNGYGFPWINCRDDITAIVIGEGITSIANKAFGAHTGEELYGNVTSITLPSSLTTIGSNAFDGCSGLTIDLSDIPANVSTIGEYAFNNVHLTATLTALETGSSVERLSSVFRGYTVEVSFKRSFTSGVASTICLPFQIDNITIDDITGVGKVYEFVGVEYDDTDGWVATMQDATPGPGNEVTFTTVNKPYLFMPSATGEVTFRGLITSVPELIDAGISRSGDWLFLGTYSRLAYGTAPFSDTVFGFAASTTAEDKEKGQDAVTAGEFVKAISGAYIPAFRAFLTYEGTDPDLQARATRGGAGVPDRITVRLIGKSGEIDGIGEIRLNTGEVTFDPNTWYDLNGRRLDGKPTQKGIYINKGKKVAIK